jgi:hypothetical protein
MCLWLSHRPSYTICSRVYNPNRRVKFEEGIPRGFLLKLRVHARLRHTYGSSCINGWLVDDYLEA